MPVVPPDRPGHPLMKGIVSGTKVHCYREQGPHGLWKVMDIDNTMFQDLESFGKKSYSKLIWRSFGVLFGAILKYV